MNPDIVTPTITPEQCRAARAALGMTVADLRTLSGCSLHTIVKHENGGEVRASIADRLRASFEAEGITFAPDGRGVSW